MAIMVGHLPCIECHGSGSVTGDSACESCGGKGYLEVAGRTMDSHADQAEQAMQERISSIAARLRNLNREEPEWSIDKRMKEATAVLADMLDEDIDLEELEEAYTERGTIVGDNGEIINTKLSVADLGEFLYQHDMMDKPYNVTITPSLAAFLDNVVRGVEWSNLPVGVNEIEKHNVEGFRSMYGFTYTLQASRQLAEDGPGEIIVGTKYGPLLVLGSPALPDGTFYLQYILNDPAELSEAEQEIHEKKKTFFTDIDDNLLIRGMYRTRHFFANIYDYTSSLWPDGWYRMRKGEKIDEVTYVREGRTSHGQGMPLVWATNQADGNHYSFERVTVLDLFDAKLLYEVLDVAMSSGEKNDWWGETEWPNVIEGIERIRTKLG